jgi:hypothetical protein
MTLRRQKSRTQLVFSLIFWAGAWNAVPVEASAAW